MDFLYSTCKTRRYDVGSVTLRGFLLPTSCSIINSTVRIPPYISRSQIYILLSTIQCVSTLTVFSFSPFSLWKNYDPPQIYSPATRSTVLQQDLQSFNKIYSPSTRSTVFQQNLVFQQDLQSCNKIYSLSTRYTVLQQDLQSFNKIYSPSTRSTVLQQSFPTSKLSLLPSLPFHVPLMSLASFPSLFPSPCPPCISFTAQLSLSPQGQGPAAFQCNAKKNPYFLVFTLAVL
jgi:hypothetical protein